MTDHDLRPPQQRARTAQGSPSSAGKWVVGAVAIAAAVAIGWWGRDYWQQQNQDRGHAAPAAEVMGSAAPAPADAPAPLQPLESVASPAVQPADTAPAASPMLETDAGQEPIALTESVELETAQLPNLDQLVVEWLGSSAMRFLVTPNLAHHIVATIDNLPRSHAAPRLWPLSPVGGRMVLQQNAQGMYIATSNSARYDAVVNFVTMTDPAQVAQWYRQAYPALQQTYEDLGYPGQSFNQRLLAVIDHLMQTPQVAQPIELRLVQVQTEGEVAPQQPWLRYEYADAQLQSLSAGQKILLRLGPDHRQRIAAYLQALRAQLAP